MADLTQTDRLIRIYTPLGDDAVLVRSFEGSEEMSGLFDFRVELVSTNGAIQATDIVGKRATLSIVQADRSTERFFDGFVARFAQLPTRGRLYRYEARLVPWLWFLTRTTDCRIYQEKTVPEIIEDVFSRFGFTDYQVQLSGSHDPWNYCVQYRETSFNFISRLMEKEGIFYFFKHENGKHTMILADKSSVHQPCPYQSSVRMEPATSSGFLRPEDTINHWERYYHFRTGKWAQTDYNYETPTTSLMVNDSTVLNLDGISKFEFYDYPGAFDSKGYGESLTKLRMEEEEAGFDLAQGASDCRSFYPGFKFTLKFHEQKDQNTTYTLLSVNHSGSQGSLYGEFEGEQASYENRFRCFPDKVQFRPMRLTPKSIVHGCQTAVVVGPDGEEIYTDSYGRVKVQFFWDRLGQKNEKSSCWVRVSQPWAGKNWGAIWIPRIGQEVVVDFLEGDPDRPLIVGRVYNEQQTVPYDVPGNSTQSGFKSRSSKGGGSADFNEIRFEDKKGSEEVFVQAQKDLNIVVEHDEGRTVGHDRTKTVSHDETTTIGNNRTETVSHDESITIGNNRTETVGSQESGTIGQKRSWSIGQEDDLTVGEQISITAGMKITIQAGVEIQIMAGASMITLGPQGIAIAGVPMVQITGAPLVMIN
jgi:type VI secretion system secreted protein VgrG